MSWKNRVAHKITLGYLNLKYGVPIKDLLADPAVRQLPFYKDEAPPDALRESIDRFAGEFTTWLANLKLDLARGRTLNSADNDLFNAAIHGANRASLLGAAVDDNFLFRDEP